MTTASRERRADFLAREDHLLETAKALLAEGGYQCLTMNRLAERGRCSRRTAYAHFDSADEVIMALSIQSTAQRAAMLARAATFKGRPRERFGAMGEVARVLAPYHMTHELILYVNGIHKRTSPERQRLLQSQEERIVSIACGVIRDAIAVGDLELPAVLTPEQLVLSCHVLSIGGYAITERGMALGPYAPTEPMEIMNVTGNLLFDLLGWRPLSHEVDWEARMGTMWKELFPEELAEAGALS